MFMLPQNTAPGEFELPDEDLGLDAGDRYETLDCFRRQVYSCLTRRADALFELTDAVLCAAGPVRSLAELSLEPEHRRGHGGLYDGLNAGWMDIARLRRALVSVPLPRVGERIVLGVDVSAWPRPDAETSPQRLFCHKHGRAKGTSQMIPGWPYSIVAALETGRTSWTTVLDAVRLGRGCQMVCVTECSSSITASDGEWWDGDPDDHDGGGPAGDGRRA